MELLRLRDHNLHEIPKDLSVMELFQMAELMYDDVIAQLRRQIQYAVIEIQILLR